MAIIDLKLPEKEYKVNVKTLSGLCYYIEKILDFNCFPYNFVIKSGEYYVSLDKITDYNFKDGDTVGLVLDSEVGWSWSGTRRWFRKYLSGGRAVSQPSATVQQTTLQQPNPEIGSTVPLVYGDCYVKRHNGCSSLAKWYR